LVKNGRCYPAEAQELYQRQANAAKEKYYRELAEYKKSPEYDAYQKYLEEFKAERSRQYNGSSCSRFLLVFAHMRYQVQKAKIISQKPTQGLQCRAVPMRMATDGQMKSFV
jgi:hypothetical protein